MEMVVIERILMHFVCCSW